MNKPLSIVTHPKPINNNQHEKLISSLHHLANVLKEARKIPEETMLHHYPLF